MTAASNKTFVGFGFGPIQSGLFLYEAYVSGRFSRFVVAEIDAELVRAVRSAGGRCTVNIARKDRVDRCRLEGLELYDPREPADRRKLVEAVAASDEMATSLPSVKFYDSAGPASAASILADGFASRPRPFPTVLYAAENHNHAAEILRKAVARQAPPVALGSVHMLNTVIGKMSGAVRDAQTIERLGLERLVPDLPLAVLVEEFNRILISRVLLSGYRRGIEVFVEKDDLLPFEEAKLYGHNAVHALIGYLAGLKGLATIDQAGRDPRIMAIARKAFIDESGAALIARHAGLGEELFTPAGYRQYADDLLDRMTRANLSDGVDRVCRDPERKLAYDDRFYGTMRLALNCGIAPTHLALGAAAAIIAMTTLRDESSTPPADLPRMALRSLLLRLWEGKADEHAGKLIDLTWEAMEGLKKWK